jgi:hypothetical protein
VAGIERLCKEINKLVEEFASRRLDKDPILGVHSFNCKERKK